MLCLIKVQGLRVPVRIGVPEQERRSPQPIEIDIQFEFRSLPQACVSDELSDSICYDQVCKKVLALCSGREFKMIEHLAHEIFVLLRKDFPSAGKVSVQVRKVSPPIPDLTGGAAFLIEE